MIRPICIKQVRHLPPFILVLLLSGCGGGSSSDTDASEVRSTQLTKSSTPEAFTEYVKEGMRNLARVGAIDRSGGSPAVLPVPVDASEGSADSSSNGFSSTNLVEEGVDEAGVMKFDGEHLYVVEQPKYRWGWAEPLPVSAASAQANGSVPVAATSPVSPAVIVPEQPPQPAVIHVYKTTEEPAAAVPVGAFELSEPGLRVEGLYLYPIPGSVRNGLVAASSSTQYGWDLWSHDGVWRGGKTSIHFYDLEDAATLKESAKLEWQGYYVGSRRIGNTLYVVSRHTPSIAELQFWPSSKEQEARNLELIDAADSDDLLPHLIVNDGNERLLVEGGQCFLADAIAPESRSPSILTITAIDLRNPTQPKSVCSNALGGGLYVSTKAIYLSEARYSKDDAETSTLIHKFALNSDSASVDDAESGIEYRGAGKVPGLLGSRSPLFRMSEQDDLLRVVSTSESNTANPRHELSVLQDSGSGSLDLIAALPNAQRPQPIGKAGEDIYGVRFLGERGYIVSFRSTDPLYVVDLAAPNDPLLVGELEIPGVSEYLQLVDEDTLLGIGRLEGSLQVSLFDVSQPEAPKQVDNLKFGGLGTDSPFFHDHHALALLEDDITGITRLALPVIYRQNWQIQQLGLQLLSLDGSANQIVGQGVLAAMSAEDLVNADDQGLNLGDQRGLIDNGAVHYISGHHIWSARWEQPDQVNRSSE